MECPICHTTNHHLATVCTGCGGYLRNKVDNLDLFSMIGEVLTSPRDATERIASAVHKNYVTLLSALGGVGISFLILTATHAGDWISSLPTLFVAGILGGILIGLIFTTVASLLLVPAGKVLRTRIRFRDAFAVVSYSWVPVCVSVVLLLPLEVMTFGKFLFTKEPSAYSLNPTSFVLFCVLDASLGIWTIWIYFTGIRRLANVSRGRAIVPGLIPLVFLTGCTLLAVYLAIPGGGG